MRLALLSTWSITVFVSVSCNSNHASNDDSLTRRNSSQVVPMTYDQWKSCDFTNTGLRITLPSAIDVEEGLDGTTWGVSMGLHYLSPPPGVLADATVFIHIYVKRLTLEQLTEKKNFYLGSGLYKRGGENDHKFWFWYYDLHPETSRWDGKSSTYRRDIKLNDKEILHTRAEVLNAGPQESQDADHAAVRRILDSIQPLSVSTNK